MKGFSSRQYRWQHEKNCSSKPTVPISTTNNNTTNANHSYNTTTNSHNNTTINNTHIHINAFGHEDVSHITAAFLDQVVRRRDKGLIELAQKIHFDKPSNRNIRIRNRKNNMIEYHDGKRWIYEEKNRVLHDVMDKSQTMMQDHFDERKNIIKASIQRFWYDAICEWFIKTRDGNTKEAEDVLKRLYIMILNECNDKTRDTNIAI